MDEAIELAKRSIMESKHGCVIVHGRNGIVASGINEHLHNQEDRSIYSIHAEMNALCQLLRIKSHNERYMRDCVALVARVGPLSTGHAVRMSRPCEKCEKQLRKMGIRKVYYTFDQNHIGELVLHNKNNL